MPPRMLAQGKVWYGKVLKKVLSEKGRQGWMKGGWEGGSLGGREGGMLRGWGGGMLGGRKGAARRRNTGRDGEEVKERVRERWTLEACARSRRDRHAQVLTEGEVTSSGWQIWRRSCTCKSGMQTWPSSGRTSSASARRSVISSPSSLSWRHRTTCTTASRPSGVCVCVRARACVCAGVLGLRRSGWGFNVWIPVQCIRFMSDRWFRV